MLHEQLRPQPDTSNPQEITCLHMWTYSTCYNGKNSDIRDSDNRDFKPVLTKIAEILPLSVVTADKGYDSEANHLLVRKELHAFSIIPARYEHLPVWRTHGKYRKQMKHGYSKLLYNQRNKVETIMSVIKRLFGQHLMSRLTRTQNKEL